MNNETILIKVQQRLNKLSSFDFDNIESWMIVEAFNKAQLEFARREIKKGEVEKQTIEDIQILITEIALKGTNEPKYFETTTLPSNYLGFGRIKCKGDTKDCDPRSLKVYIGEEANSDELLTDPNKNPNFEWAETFLTFVGNKIRIYTDNKFTIKEPYLIYYKKPQPIRIVGVFDLTTQTEATTESICVFKDDVVETLIEETCLILSGDIESINQIQRTTQTIQRNQ